MTKADVLNGARGKPAPFGGPDGFACLLRPLSWGERKEMFDWARAEEAKGNAAGDFGLELQRRLVLAAVCDEAGAKLLDATDLDGFALPIVDALATEIARRNGLDGKAAGEPGKAASPATKS